MEYKDQLDKLKKDIDEKKVQKAKLEERLENLEKDGKQIQEDLKELNVTSEDLEEVISKLEKEIKEEIDLCKKSLQ